MNFKKKRQKIKQEGSTASESRAQVQVLLLNKSLYIAALYSLLSVYTFYLNYLRQLAGPKY